MDVEVILVKTPNNGGCGECECDCHTDVPNPRAHIHTCKFADLDYVPPGWPPSSQDSEPK